MQLKKIIPKQIDVSIVESRESVDSSPVSPGKTGFLRSSFANDSLNSPDCLDHSPSSTQKRLNGSVVVPPVLPQQQKKQGVSFLTLTTRFNNRIFPINIDKDSQFEVHQASVP